MSGQVKMLVHGSAIPAVSSQLSRRGFMVASAIGVGAALTGCGGRPGAATASAEDLSSSKIESSMVLANFANYVSPDNLTAFTKADGPTVTVETYNSGSELIAKLNGGGATYDVVVPGTTETVQLVDLKLLRKLDHSLLPNLSNLLPAMTKTNYDPGNVYTVPKAIGVASIWWRTKVVDGSQFTSLADVFDFVVKSNKQYKVNFFETAKETMTLALAAAGKPMDSEVQADIDAARDLLIAAKPNITTYSNDELTLARNNQIDIGMGYNTNVFTLNQERPDDLAQILLPSVGTTEQFLDNWAIPTAAANPVAAHAFINFMLQPKVAAKETNVDHVYVPVAGIEDMLDDSIRSSGTILLTEDQLARYSTVIATPNFLNLVNTAYAEFRGA